MAFSTTAKLVPPKVKGGTAFTPILWIGGVPIENNSGAYNTRGGFLWHPEPGIVQFQCRTVLTNRGTGTGPVILRLPDTDAAGFTIPFPKLSTTHCIDVFNAVLDPVDQYTCFQSNASRSLQIYKRVGASRTAMIETDISAGGATTLNVYATGFYFYDP